MGYPTIFVRFTGCHLRCTYCDTTYAYYEGNNYHPEDIMEAIRTYPCRRVCLTGGEPLLQPQREMQRLLDLLYAEGYEVSIETDGAVDLSQVHLHERQRFVVDMKVPSSGMSGRMDFANLRRIVPERDEIKFVVGEREDFDWSLQLIRDHQIFPSQGYRIIFSPVFGAVSPRELAEWILEEGIDVRMQIQLHKIIWHPTQRGV